MALDLIGKPNNKIIRDYFFNITKCLFQLSAVILLALTDRKSCQHCKFLSRDGRVSQQDGVMTLSQQP